MLTTHSLISPAALPSRNRSWSLLSALVLTFGFLTLLAAPAHAVTTILGTGSLDATDPTFDRPNAGTPPTATSGSATFRYDTLPFTISTSGLWTILARAAGSGGGTLGDPWLVIYETAFNPASPLTNVLGSDDDAGGSLDSAIVLNLTSGVNYFAVVTTFSAGASGTYTIEQRDPPAPPALAATHWLGQTSSLWSAANWASDAAGTPTTLTPTASDDITFAATGAANQVNTNLDAAFTINSLTVNSATGISTTATPTLTINQTTTLNSLLSVNTGVTVIGNDTFTVATTGTLAGTGDVQMAVNKNIINNGAISVGDPSVAAAASSLFLTTSGTGAVVMGTSSTLLVDLFTGAALGDNTGLATSSDRLDLTGTLNAAAGGTLVIGNPAAMTGFAGGDQWLLVDLNSGDGAITGGTLAVNDSDLGLSSTQVGNFNQTSGVYQIIDVKSGLDMAHAQDQGITSTIQGILGDINGRLFNLRAGSGEEGMGGAMNGEVVEGEGDGPEDSMARSVPRSRQWEVFTTVNYANMNLNSIGTQAGVDSHTWAPGVGIERHFTRNLTLGFATNLLETQQDYTNALGSLDMEGVALSAYASYVRSSFWLDMLYSFGHFDLDSTRNASGFPTATGETTAMTNALQLNGGWSFRVPAWKLVHGPIAGVDWLHLNVDGYNETGGGLGALAYANRNVDSLLTRIGWSVTREIVTDFAIITPQLRVSYERQNISNNDGTSVNLINQPFMATTNNQSPGQDYMVAGAGVNFQFTPVCSLLLTYQGQFLRQDMSAHFGALRLSYKF